MTRSKFSRILFLPIMLCILLAFVACGTIEAPSTDGGGGKPGNDPGSKTQLASVDASSIKITETVYTLVVEWNAVPNATQYRLLLSQSGSSSSTVVTVEDTVIDIKQIGYFVVPDNGAITISFTARGAGYADSEPVTITYELEGTLLLSPEIVSFNNGVIEWNAIAGATSYTVKVNGTAETVTTNSYNIGSLSADATIEITATIGGKLGAPMRVMYNASTKSLSAMPISDYTDRKSVV